MKLRIIVCINCAQNVNIGYSFYYCIMTSTNEIYVSDIFICLSVSVSVITAKLMKCDKGFYLCDYCKTSKVVTNARIDYILGRNQIKNKQKNCYFNSHIFIEYLGEITIWGYSDF